MNIIELIEITFRREKAGNVAQNAYGEYDIDSITDDALWSWLRKNEDGLISFPEDFWGISFRPTGLGFDGEFGGINYSINEIGNEDVFHGYLNTLIEMGNNLLDERIEKNKEFPDLFNPVPSEVTFITKWRFECGRDWEGEYWEEYDLIGLLEYE